MPKVLMVLSAADALTLADGSAHPTGFWAEEVAVSHEVLRAAGIDVEVATPGGRRPVVDPISLDERGGIDAGTGAAFRAALDAMAADLAAPQPLADVRAEAYDAVYLPGGHAPMADLATDADLGRLLREADRAGTVVAALCHGVAALLSASGDDGGFLFAGRRLASFTDEEERQGGLGDAAPWLVESRLRERGAVVEAAAPWSSHVVVDGTLVTGQNPQSSRATAERVAALLGG